jgi:hypothetical protein
MSAEKKPVFKKTILVGLGGAGKLILTHLKKQFIDMYDVVPPCIKFISLDTDPAPLSLRSTRKGLDVSLDEREFLYMKVEQPIDFINSSSVKDWFISPLPSGSISRGAGAVREVGRVAFFYHFNKFMSDVDGLISELNAQGLHNLMDDAKNRLNASTDFGLSGLDTEIYICGSLAGGTGSGTFIDVAILMRDTFKNALIHGFFLLNWIYRNKAFAYRVPGNVYAALSELDNLQSIIFGDRHFVPYSVQYADKKIEVTKPPFELVHLVDGRNEYGENVLEVSELCETIATAIFLSVSAMGDAIASVVDNLLAHVNASPRELWDNRYPKYSSFGLSSLYYPADELYRYIYHSEAEKLCEMALAEVQGGISDPQRFISRDQHIFNDVNMLFGTSQLNLLNRDFVRDKVCPFQAPISFPIQKFQISDKVFPAMIVFQFEQEENNLLGQIQNRHQEDGALFIKEIAASLSLKMRSIEQYPSIDKAFLKKWIESASGLLTKQKEDATRDHNKETDNIRSLREKAESLKQLSVQSRYLPILGGSRTNAVNQWAAAIVDYLTAVKDEKRYDAEIQFYEEMIKTLGVFAPGSVQEDSEVINVLENARAKLQALRNHEGENLRSLKSKTNQLLVGGGNLVVVDANQGDASLLDKISLDYEQFKTERHINTPEDFLAAAMSRNTDLFQLFLEYCADRLKHLKEISLTEAMTVIGRSRGNTDEYITGQIGHLFRLSSALWSFNKGKLNLNQQQHYDNIVNFGVLEQAEGRLFFNSHVQSVKAKYQIRADHTYSTTGDKNRIWLLNFAAALPAYFLKDLEYNRQKYFNEISPTYHIDKYFEMNVPDLFPVAETANKALRAIGMAIVPGIDVILDTKLPKGHQFTFAHPEYIKQNNHGLPFEWKLFRDMYDYIVSDYDEKETDNFLNVLIALLKDKIQAMSVEDIQKAIKQYIEKVKEKLESRNFSRLISARLTFREIKELETFLDPKGYGMDIEKYIEGKLK